MPIKYGRVFNFSVHLVGTKSGDLIQTGAVIRRAKFKFDYKQFYNWNLLT